MSSRDEEQEVFYEEEEVLWAKIRGYPWWPAFVDKIHPPSRGKETEYTVFFFGDNTQYPSSKLGASKLRKFYENYAEFYQKARAHRKLMTSIQMAEEKLKQNDQNVEIFEELRSNLKVAKKGKNNSIDRKSSKISEPDPEISAGKEQLPDLNKSKTFAHTRRRKNLVHLDEQQQIQQSVNESQPNRKTIKKQEIVHSSQKKTKRQQLKKEISPPLPPKRKRHSKQQIFQEQSQEEPIKQVVEVQQKSKVHVPNPNPNEMEDENQQESQGVEESMQEQEARQQSSEDNVYQKKLRNSVKRKNQSEKHSGGPRKRGRPKKKFLRHLNDEKIESLNRIPVNRISHLKRKIIHKQRFSPKKIQNNLAILSEEDNLIIQQIKRILHKRQELVDYLGSISITINNVQQILELGVSNILQQGDKNSKVNQILFILRNVLLYKYFPDDIKHKKKYEKILKRKPITIKNDENDKQQSEQNKETKQEHQIRKKTVVKLEKFLKMHPDIDNKAKQLAVRIESYFEKADSGIGDRYKSIAFKVLSNLKEKKESFAEVIKKLDQHAYD